VLPIVVVCGYKTFELVEKLVDDSSSNLQVGFGITHAGVADPSNLTQGDCQRADAMTAALMSSKTLDQVAAAGKAQIQYSELHAGAGVSYHAPGLVGSKSLRGNGLL
jgi:hypothetical protein